MKSIIRNFTTAFFAGFVSSILIIVYVYYAVQPDEIDIEVLFLIASFMMIVVCTTVGFLGFLFLSLLSNIFNWSESKDYLLKIIFTTSLYLPLYFLMQEFGAIHAFWCWSLAGTLAVITFDYKHLFSEHFSCKKRLASSENLSESNSQQRL